ncbi:MAG: carboxylating nicotinate-nucleotide diphosphorylase, partial [Candidatus Bathyarchaeia archaeon]
MFLPKKILYERLLKMLAEDLGQGDTTTSLIIPQRGFVEADVIAKQSGIVAGIEEAEVLLEGLGLKFKAYVKDGDEIKLKQVLMRISGDARTVLSVERTLLNIMSRMSGIATMTRRIVDAVNRAGYKTKIACTRKTAPGMLYFDKKAVFIGGGDPHRLHLDDMILIKDNHIAIAGSVKKAVELARQKASFSKKIEVEVTDVKDVLTAAEAGADIIMLDNFSLEKTKEAVNLLKQAGLIGKVLIEASGGITSENFLDFASEEVDIISLGEITHSVKGIDLSLEVQSFK